MVNCLLTISIRVNVPSLPLCRLNSQGTNDDQENTSRPRLLDVALRWWLERYRQRRLKTVFGFGRSVFNF